MGQCSGFTQTDRSDLLLLSLDLDLVIFSILAESFLSLIWTNGN